MAAPPPGRRRPSPRTVLAAGLLAAAVVPLGATPAAADHDAPCSVAELPQSERLADTHAKDNAAFDRMHVEQAQELATGRGVKVAVIDSGVMGVEGLDVVGGVAVPGVSPNALLSGHGTIVGGLIAGPQGVAPDAQVYDVKVYDAEDADTTQGERPLTSAGIVAGIEAVISAQPQQRFDIVNISLAVRQSDPALEAAVARLVALDVVVVAAAGNAASSTPDGFAGTPGNDAEVYPADYPGVLAVSATPPGDENPSAYVVPNADTDVAAPTVGALSANATGQACVVGEVATSWATAEVSGVLALLAERFPRDTPQQLVARLQATAEGAGAARDDASSPWTGAGVVQAHDALTREIRPGRKGKVETTVQEVRADAQAPPAPRRVDLFGTPRAILLWSGLVAGSLLALASMLRPLLRR
ncbi:S8 family serine peptidase [Nocardioides sp. zg-1228]|uniref:S8 family serine peptidase n=1 Tax=Nocardioides sp. zg-1228 TaxID=2763008 RepID=UPI0016433374|nr:S8 family serine peptidase [Nocardioides sp. zg-1228]MBC2932389.1 S8 family serine peptidase [Nocardioides sp. zg-1228]QSF57901.1 S8 family serine peptidase [Nocardioides sp. zg-1228]